MKRASRAGNSDRWIRSPCLCGEQTAHSGGCSELPTSHGARDRVQFQIPTDW